MADLRFDKQSCTSVPCDLVDVVRCKNCMYWSPWGTDERGICRLWSDTGKDFFAAIPDGFCHMGKRRNSDAQVCNQA